MKVCARAGCPELSAETYCAAHKRAVRATQDKLRGSSTRRGLDARWRKLRSRVVKAHVAANGWICPGYNIPPHNVQPGLLTGDHIIPRSSAPHLTLEPTNVAVLCLACNSAKGTKHAA